MLKEALVDCPRDSYCFSPTNKNSNPGGIPAPLMFLPIFWSLAPTNGRGLKGCYALGGL